MSLSYATIHQPRNAQWLLACVGHTTHKWKCNAEAHILCAVRRTIFILLKRSTIFVSNGPSGGTSNIDVEVSWCRFHVVGIFNLHNSPLLYNYYNYIRAYASSVLHNQCLMRTQLFIRNRLVCTAYHCYTKFRTFSHSPGGRQICVFRRNFEAFMVIGRLNSSKFQTIFSDKLVFIFSDQQGQRDIALITNIQRQTGKWIARKYLLH